MTNTADNRKLWSFHAENGQRFLDEHMIALDGADLGDLSPLPDSKEAFRKKYEEARPAEAGAAAKGANLYYRLVHEVHAGDYVALSWSGEICLGTVEGAYAYDGTAEGFEHRRVVQWEKRMVRGDLPRTALRELDSSPMRLFAVMGNGNGFLSAVGKPPLQAVPKPRTATSADADSVPGLGAVGLDLAGPGTAGPGAAGAGLVGGTAPGALAGAALAGGGASAAGTAARAVPAMSVLGTDGGWWNSPVAPVHAASLPAGQYPKAVADPRRFLLDDWTRRLDASDLRDLVAGLLRAMGYGVEPYRSGTGAVLPRSQSTPEPSCGGGNTDTSPDKDGADFAAVRDELTPRLLVLVRRGSVMVEDVERLHRAMEPGELGALFTMTELGAQVREQLASAPYIRGVSGMDLAGLVLRYYGKLEEKYRCRIPLRMVYVPAT